MANSRLDFRHDLVRVYDQGGPVAAWIHLAMEKGFEHRSFHQTLAGFWDSQKWLVGDFNGDGKDDLVNVYGASW